jgi:hypothetical protein
VAGYVFVQWIHVIRIFLRTHWVFGIAFLAGLAVRVITMLGFPPAIWYGGDSASYVSTADNMSPGISRLSGYGLVLRLLRPFHSFAVVTAASHLMGLAIGVLTYALLRRYGLPGWGATLAALPVLADVYQIQLEHEILASATFGFLIATAVIVLLWWRGTQPPWAPAAAALLLGMASTLWPVGLPLLLLLLAYLLVRRAGWRAVGSAVIAGSLPLMLYLGWFDSHYHQIALNDADGVFLWSRTMTFADCAVIKPPADEAPLCVRTPAAKRWAPDAYIWAKKSPLNGLPGPKFSAKKDALARDFALRAITAQPGSYLNAVLDDFSRTFTWNRPAYPSQQFVDRYQFTFATSDWVRSRAEGLRLAREQRAYTGGSTAKTRAVQPLAGFMRDYQRFAYVRGTMLAAVLLLGLAAIARSWSAGGWRRLRGWGGHALFPLVAALAMLLVPDATAGFSERYVVPAMPVACLAAALAFARTPRDPAAAQPQPATAQPQPAAAQPQPAAAQPEPAAAQPEPATAQPEPAGVQPQPAGAQPHPGTTPPVRSWPATKWTILRRIR